MIKNNLYNLMLQMVEEHKSLWRIKDDYLKDSKNEKDCAIFWQKLIKDKEEHIRDLKILIKKHLEK